MIVRKNSVRKNHRLAFEEPLKLQPVFENMPAERTMRWMPNITDIAALGSLSSGSIAGMTFR
jgi:hypothetical protein